MAQFFTGWCLGYLFNFTPKRRIKLPLPKLKDNATEQEKNEWIVKANEEYNKIEAENITLNETIKNNNEKINDLQELNQKLFVRVTSGKKENETEMDEVPDCIEKEMYDQLSESMKEELKEILEGDDE